VVIERALEKLKQAGDMRAGRFRPLTETALQRAGRQVGRRVSDVPIDRHQLPRVQVDLEYLAANRVLVQETKQIDEARAGAAYRLLRARLMHRMHGNNWTTLAITSASAGDGKSLTTLNLAFSLARARKGDVVVLDLDLRNPSICQYLGVDPPRDLASYFAGAVEPKEVFFTIGIDNLLIAGSSAPIEHPSEMIASGRFEELLGSIATLSSDPVVLIDLPPLLVTDEALLVAPRVDAIALVIAEGRTKRDFLARAKHLLEEFPFAGVILNRASESFGADAYYGYGDRYRYRSRAAPKA
jgi:capsular exopolysaccharide synthesis family protein